MCACVLPTNQRITPSVLQRDARGHDSRPRYFFDFNIVAANAIK